LSRRAPTWSPKALGVRQAPPGQRRRRRRWTLLLFVTLLVLIAGGLLWTSQSPFFEIDTVTVEGAQTLDPQELADISGLQGQNIFRAGVGAAKERLLALEMMKSVSISRRWPDGMHITVEERQPWGYWQIDAVRYVIDTDGLIMYRVLPPEGAPIVLDLTGEQRGELEPGDRVDRDAVRLVQRLIEAVPSVLGWTPTSFQFRNEDGVTAILEGEPNGGILRAVFGDGRDLDYKLSVLSALLQRTQAEGRQVHSVDLRFGERVSFE
jgi:cell division protein FtsQ